MLKKTLLIIALLFPSLLLAAPVNVNIADAREIRKQLRGIGPVLAARIVEERKANGAYYGPEDLDRVRGIGPKTLAKNARDLRFY